MISRRRIELSQVALWVMAALVAGNGLLLYHKAAQRKQVAALRQDLAAQAARIDSSRLAAALEDPWRLAAVLAEVQRESGNAVAWIQLRDEKGAIAAHAGAPAEYSLSESALPQLRRGRPVYRVVETHAGSLLVEAFLVPLAAGIRQGDGILVTDSGGRYAVIELAARIRSRIAAPAPNQASQGLTIWAPQVAKSATLRQTRPAICFRPIPLTLRAASPSASPQCRAGSLPM